MSSKVPHIETQPQLWDIVPRQKEKYYPTMGLEVWHLEGGQN